MSETVILIFGFLLLEAFALGIFADFDWSIFNPIRNYKKWIKLNWLGISIITLLLNIIFIPYAFCYWGIYKAFTVGRKN